MLLALNAFPPAIHANIRVTTPHLYQYTPITNTQILQDYPSSLELMEYMSTHSIPTADVTRLGIAIGSWLKKFHEWGSAPEQALLRETMRKNDGMKKLKSWLNYGRLLPTIKMFPALLEECRDMFTEIEEKYKKEAEVEGGELIHGDFWSGK